MNTSNDDTYVDLIEDDVVGMEDGVGSAVGKAVATHARDQIGVSTEASSKEAGEMLEAIDALRFRMLSVAMGTSAELRNSQDLIDESLDLGTIVKGVSGLTYAKAGNSMLFLVPELETKAACEQVANDISLAYDSLRSRYRHWAIDFSAVSKTPSVLFLGIVKAYGDDLQKYGGSLSIAWLKTSLFSPIFVEQLCRSLNLKQVGGFLFSRQCELIAKLEKSSSS